MEYERNSDIPNWLKWSLTVFNRAGFPAFAFLVISYMCFVNLKDQTKVIEEFKITMQQMTASIDRNTVSVERMTSAIYKTR